MCESKRPILLNKNLFSNESSLFSPFSNSFDLVFENLHVVAKVREVEGGKKFSSDVQTSLPILADKAYVGLTHCNVTTPVKRNEKPYKKAKEDNKALSSKRIKVEHVFASLKSWRILKKLHFYSRKMIDMIFQGLVNIYNLNQLIKLNEVKPH